MPKVSVFVKLTAKPGQRDEMVEALGSVRALIDAEEGTEMYTVHTDTANEDVVWMLEVYEDQAAFDAHGSGEALSQLFGSLGGLIGAPPEMHITTPVGGKGITP